MTLQMGSLVLYKNQPAVIRQIADKKLTIELPDGQQVSVRQKDIALLHPGPIRSVGDIQPIQGDILTAWELLDSQATNLSELAELAYGEYTPSTAWATWQYVEDGLYFEGLPEAIQPHDAAKVNDILALRQTKAAEANAWQAFVKRVESQTISPEDERYFQEIEELAFGRSDTSRILRQLRITQTPETAHEFLLKTGYWTSSTNPYPARLGLPTTQPCIESGELPDEPRRDLTHLVSLAIDDEGSSDPDDALSVDGDRLWVHIADIAALVPPDSPADREARDRGANLYLPEGTVHMLPVELTQRLGLGLQPVSPALSFALSVDEQGGVNLLEFVPSWIKATRLTYEAVEASLGDDPFNQLLLLAERYFQRRIANQAIEIDLPEVKVRVEPDGSVAVKPLPSFRSRFLVREAMLMVGEVVGRLGVAQNIPLAYSVQDPPQEIVMAVNGYAGMFAQRKAMQRSQQRTEPGAHAGLGLGVYVQATSPLRRYLDLVAHQQLRAYIRGESMLSVTDIAQRLGAVAEVSRAVRAVERSSNQHWTLVYLEQHPDWLGRGIVIEEQTGKDLILIPDLAWETELFRRQPRGLNTEVSLMVDLTDLPNRTARFVVKN